MTKEELMKKKAYLESINDQLVTELQNIDSLMRMVGFTDGLATVKATAQALYNEGMEEFESGEE